MQFGAKFWENFKNYCKILIFFAKGFGSWIEGGGSNAPLQPHAFYVYVWRYSKILRHGLFYVKFGVFGNGTQAMAACLVEVPSSIWTRPLPDRIYEQGVHILQSQRGLSGGGGGTVFTKNLLSSTRNTFDKIMASAKSLWVYCGSRGDYFY